MKAIIIFLAVFIVACHTDRFKNLHETQKNLGDFIDINAIKKAEISNNNGTFFLNTGQLENFKNALKKLSYEPSQDVKVGAKGIIFTIGHEEYFLATRTQGEFAEIIINNKSLVFKTNGLNLDNYVNINLMLRQ